MLAEPAVSPVYFFKRPFVSSASVTSEAVQRSDVSLRPFPFRGVAACSEVSAPSSIDALTMSPSDLTNSFGLSLASLAESVNKGYKGAHALLARKLGKRIHPDDIGSFLANYHEEGIELCQRLVSLIAPEFSLGCLTQGMLSQSV
ncbi:hypothetical protein Nepgr_000196 [Nepenthes gracilis]|uniref:Uncharacterized protein n=1 Tax=Nepenthes gracilis TaxID=150966 RepID=A0AAD3P626_NEPGR|nr:hypothetical protein Nepgr_000196 [Nepenthes gracilis]